METQEGGGVGAIFAIRTKKAPGTAEVIFRAGATDGWPGIIPIHKKLYLSFTLPAIVVGTPGNIGADIMTSSFYILQNCVGNFCLKGIATAPLRMKISIIIGNRR